MPPDLQPRAAVELVDVVKEFGSERVLDGVDLAVPAGAITVLLGPSGAGKTVTIQHILGLLKPSAGVVKVDGEDLAAISEEELYEVRRGMSVVLQGSLPFTCGLFYSLNVYENVAYGLRERTRWSDERIDRVTKEALRTVGLQDHADRMPGELSGGMAKRTALARALALKSSIVIIDDLDAGLDSVRLSLLCAVIRDAQEDTDATVLVTTHDMKVARDLADFVALIHEGRIIANGEADAVLGSDEPFVRQFVSGARSGPLQLRDT
ncbi:MAG: ATP-binding cassette domain-containing protein [Thermoleophilaceae bacterium]|nr:ATP-binding cassette domain-containing protein [Thermoleophilaceae bacterium]